MGATEPVSIGLNPLFLDSDIELLSLLQKYLAERLKRPVQLIKRRTYQEITALLLSGQLTRHGSATIPTCSTKISSSFSPFPFTGMSHFTRHT